MTLGGCMKSVAIGFMACVLAITSAVIWNVWPVKESSGILALGSFLILVLTLIVLVLYAYDTNSMARVTRERWAREGVLGTIYSMELVGKKGDAGKTLFRLHNSSTLVVRAAVACNFKVYGDAVDYGPAYDGKEVWLVFPQQVIQGWFEIEALLQKKGKNVATMMVESTPGNRKDQFTMLLEVEFWDEMGSRRKLPARRHYFDFDRWVWIPHITEGQ